MVLKKGISLYERDEKGELVSKEVKVAMDEKDLKECPELEGQTVCVIPLTRGELKRMFESGVKDKDVDGEIILNNCKDPQYTKEDIPYLKPAYVRILTKTILLESGVILDAESGRKRLEGDELGKN